MLEVHSGARIALKNVLYLTDFSMPSEAALPVASAIAREFGGIVRALHVMLPDPYASMALEMAASLEEAQQEAAKAQMQRIESRLAGVAHETLLVRGTTVWPALQQAIEAYEVDVLVLGTHGRTGALKCLLGSVAEEILRRSPVPVITIGPSVSAPRSDARFDRVLLATDFLPQSQAAAPYAISFAEENDARLVLLHVIPQREPRRNAERDALSVAEAMHHLHEIVPRDAELWCRPEALVEYGDPAAKILEVAKQRQADLIVLGVRDTRHLLTATHLETTTAHKVIANAACPVLTVRANRKQAAQA